MVNFTIFAAVSRKKSACFADIRGGGKNGKKKDNK
jgi:hypothetical protein